MEVVKSLLEEKYNLLTEVLSLCNNVQYGDDMEENIIHFTELYDDREDIFKEIYRIDEMIIDIVGDKESIRDEKIRKISKEIYDFDVNYIKNVDEFRAFLNEKMKEVNTQKKLNNKFNQVNYEVVGNFSIQG